ncbi:MAG: ATPase domain-containing protein [Candidatus Methanoperedens sp.]|nr:ATPase domain-containing protein [Candidatus Methanoperedens sp.]
MPDINQTSNMKRVPTEIPGFDELCEGGLLRERTYLVSGISGAGKTIFGLQYLYNGITKYGEPGIFISTEESPGQARENVKQFGWDLNALETLGLTSLITCETIDDSTESRFGVETFVTEGTILMTHKRIDNVRVRSIEIINMKGSNHSNTIHPYEITSSGIVVHPNDEVYAFSKN